MELNMYNVHLRNYETDEVYTRRLLAPDLITAINRTVNMERYKTSVPVGADMLLDAEQLDSRTEHMLGKEVLVADYAGHWLVVDRCRGYLLLQYDLQAPMRLLVNVYDWHYEYEQPWPDGRVRIPYFPCWTEHYDVFESDKDLDVLLVQLGLISSDWLPADRRQHLLQDLFSRG